MQVGDVYVEMGLDDRQYKKDLDRAKGVTQLKGLTLGSIFSNAFSVGLGLGLVQGFRSLGGAVTDFINTAARTEVLNVAMESVARSTGRSIAAVREHKEAVMDMGIAEQEATQILTRFMQAQLDTADAAKLARVAQDAAVIAGYNSSEAAEQMTEAIAKQRPELLSAFGMTRNMNAIYTDFAQTLGKTSTQLTDGEKKQAMLNYILSEGEKIAGTYEATMGVVGKAIGSLPRYWATLRNAIAKPLALPAVGVVVDAITNGLKNAISWAEANAFALQRWGQTAANVATGVIRGFRSVIGVFIDNWATIRFAGTALLTYAVGARIAAAATGLLSTTSLILSGNLATNTGLMGWLNTLVVYYGVLMPKVATGTNLFTVALIRARVAMQALLASIPVVGWVLLALSVAVGAAVSSWGKYSASVQNAAQKAQMDKIAAQQKAMTDSALGAADGQEDLADGITEAGKAANKNLQGFDEVHTLQEDMAGAAMPALDGLGFDLDMPGPDLPPFDVGGMMADLDSIKPSLAGWWEHIMQTWRDRWQGFTAWAGNMWGDVKGHWGTFKDWVAGWAGPLWDDAKGSWGTFASWAGGIWDDTKGKWGNFGTWAGETWEGIKTKAGETWESIKSGAETGWGNIKTTVATKWESLKTGAATTWDSVKTGAANAWESIKTNSGTSWDGIKTTVQSRWDDLKTNSGSTWENIKTTIGQKWDDLKSEAPITWENIKTSVATRWNELKADAPVTWESIKDSVQSRWESLKTDAPTTWEAIKTGIQSRWEALKANAPTTWGEIKSAIVTRFGEAKDNVLTFAQQLRDDPAAAWDELVRRIKAKRDELYEKLTGPWEDAKKTILGIVEQAKSWGKNLIGNIVDGIKAKARAMADAVKSAASTIKGYLGFSSPTEKGPGRDADKWAPNLMKMYARGITGNLNLVQSAAGAVAASLQSMATMPTPAFAGMGSGRGSDRLPGASFASPATEIHLHIGTLVADKQGLVRLERLLSEVRIGEQQRVGRSG